MKHFCLLICLVLFSTNLMGQVKDIEFDSYSNEFLLDGVAVEFPTTADELKTMLKSDYRMSGLIAYFDNNGIYAVLDKEGQIVEVSVQFSPESGRATTTGHYNGNFKFDKRSLSKDSTEKQLREVIRASHFPFELMYNTVVNIRSGDKVLVFIVSPEGKLDSFLIRHEPR